MNQKLREVTHVVKVEPEKPKDCISREFHLARFDDDTFYLECRTQYEGKELLVSEMFLSAQAFDMLLYAISELSHNPDKYARKEDSHEQTN